MKEQQALDLGYALLGANSLNGWNIDISNRPKLRLGCCKYKSKIIQLSKWVFDQCPEFVENTIRHEIAHAVLGPGYGHGPRWKVEAVRLGAIPRSCIAVPINKRAAFKWKLVCPNCCRDFGGSYRKRTVKYRCRQCKCDLVQLKVE